MTFEQFMTKFHGKPPGTSVTWEAYFSRPGNKNLGHIYSDKYYQWKYAQTFKPIHQGAEPPKFRVINKKS